MRNAGKALLGWLTGVSLVAGQTLTPFPAAEPSARGVSVEGVEPVSRRSLGNAGLFVGVNEFDDQTLSPLRYAVNDAIAQAHLFVLDLKLIPPANTTLLLAGEPNSAVTKAQKAALEHAGVRMEKATKPRLLNELNRTTRYPQGQADLVIVSLSSHGFEESGMAYVMPADGLRSYLRDTGLSLKTVEEQLEGCKAGKRLLIVDACREKAARDEKSLGKAMDRVWRDALARAQGQAVLASCDVGQFSFEDPKLGHGVFTYHLLEALGGKAATDPQGLITLGHVSDYVARSVNDWVVRNRPGSSLDGAQKPWFKGPNEARDIPLAVSRAIAVKHRDGAARLQRALDTLTDARKKYRTTLTPEIEGQVEQAARKLDPDKVLTLVEQMETLSNPSEALARGFVGWWNAEGKKLAGVESPTPVSAPLVSAPAAVLPSPPVAAPVPPTALAAVAPPKPVMAAVRARPRIAIDVRFAPQFEASEASRRLFTDRLLAELNRGGEFEVVMGSVVSPAYLGTSKSPPRAPSLTTSSKKTSMIPPPVTIRSGADFSLRIEGQKALRAFRPANIGGFITVTGMYFAKAEVNMGWRLENAQGVMVKNDVVQVSKESEKSFSTTKTQSPTTVLRDHPIIDLALDEALGRMTGQIRAAILGAR